MPDTHIPTAMPVSVADGAPDWGKGTAYLDGAILPISEARIPLTDWGYRRSDVTYDVVSVTNGHFFQLDAHLKRFRASMNSMRLVPRESDDDIRTILHQLVRRSGLREAYVAMDCLRGRPPLGARYHPAYAKPYLAAYAIPYVWLQPKEVIARGLKVVVGSRPRIPEVCVDPKAKNFHWGDMNAGLFEAEEAGADTCLLLGMDGNVTEGPGFNVFTVSNGVVATPDRGVLEGITRASVIELCGHLGLPLEIRPVPEAELREADEIFLSSTAGGVMGVVKLDSRILGNGAPGAVTNRLQDAYWKMRSEGWHTEAVAYDD